MAPGLRHLLGPAMLDINQILDIQQMFDVHEKLLHATEKLPRRGVPVATRNPGMSRRAYFGYAITCWHAFVVNQSGA